MKPHRTPRTLSFISLVLLLAAPLAHSSFSQTPKPNPINHRHNLLPLSGLPVLGDFDGDLLIDRAELHIVGAHRCIRVQFGDSRENHLEIREPLAPGGRLLAWDINRDDKPDLLLIVHSRAEPAVVWFGDGRGHFIEGADGNTGVDFGLFSGESGLVGFGGFDERQIGLTPDPLSCEPTAATNIGKEGQNSDAITFSNRPYESGAYLSLFRERGPPNRASRPNQSQLN